MVRHAGSRQAHLRLQSLAGQLTMMQLRVLALQEGLWRLASASTRLQEGRPQRLLVRVVVAVWRRLGMRAIITTITTNTSMTTWQRLCMSSNCNTTITIRTRSSSSLATLQQVVVVGWGLRLLAVKMMQVGCRRALLALLLIMLVRLPLVPAVLLQEEKQGQQLGLMSSSSCRPPSSCNKEISSQQGACMRRPCTMHTLQRRQQHCRKGWAAPPSRVAAAPPTQGRSLTMQQQQLPVVVMLVVLLAQHLKEDWALVQQRLLT